MYMYWYVCMYVCIYLHIVLWGCTVVANKKLTFRSYSTIVEQYENENKIVAEWYRQKGDKRFFGRWETFRVSTMHNKIAPKLLTALGSMMAGSSTQAKSIAF